MSGLATEKSNDGLISNASSLCYSCNGCINGRIENGMISSCSNGFWSKHRDDVSVDQLQKFWSDLSPQARQDLLRIDKQVFFEQARKNMYCSRCNGLLLEVFTQIFTYGKSLQHEGACAQPSTNKLKLLKDQTHGAPCSLSTSICQDETRDPSLHPWGGVTTTKDGALTLLDCYSLSKSLNGLQNVFDGARARERERELLYPDACGGGGRGWISQGIVSYGRGHGTRETCALHTARLSCDTLVDFWSALGEETRLSLLRMKEEDFIERLMYRFDNKRFCRDCRKNVIREFKELKELKRTRREPLCTSWFCVADTTFQYEVSNDTIRADWHNTFIDSIGTYHHFEWAVGSGEGKHDILDFENVGMNGSVQVTGLNLGDLNSCHITLRAWKLDGRCTEFSVKAHALKGTQCVHCRLVVGDGYVTITHGESIKRFFEHAEEAEEEEDDDSMDKDGNDLYGDCSRPLKHAKSPELAREFLLDAATVIFKEQVEKAFREGTARQNAHSIFVCLALKLLEDRIRVACKEIITLEKQMKLLEEEEKEKREEEERRERKRTKEREKKLRRKERLREKVKDNKVNESSQTSLPHAQENECENNNRDSLSETSPDGLDESSSNDYTTYDSLHNGFDGTYDGEFIDVKEGNGSITLDSSKRSPRKLRVQMELSFNRSDKCSSVENGSVVYKCESRFHHDGSENVRHFRPNGTRFSARNSGPRFTNSCGCYQQPEYGTKVKVKPRSNSVAKMEFESQMPKRVHRTKKYNQTDYHNTRKKYNQVWEPVEPQRRDPRTNSDPNVTSTSLSFKTEGADSNKSSEVCSSKIDEKTVLDSDLDPISNNMNGILDFSGISSCSDNGSSFVSEGDSGATSSQLQNTESSSTSDSEEASVDVPTQSLVGNPVPQSSTNTTYANKSTSQPCAQHGPLLSTHNPDISFPVYYYPPNPIPWSETANGYMTYPHVNPYLVNHPFIYGHGHLQYLPSSPFISNNQVPIYHQVHRSDGLNPQSPDNVAPQVCREAPRVGPAEKDKSTKSTGSESVNRGFSLFQFGGPVAHSNFRSSIKCSDEGKNTGISCFNTEGDHGCSKEETTIQEYNLFAARNGIQFSIY